MVSPIGAIQKTSVLEQILNGLEFDRQHIHGVKTSVNDTIQYTQRAPGMVEQQTYAALAVGNLLDTYK